ncbi:MAG: hypothetical protein ACYS3N_18810 [Planctomycetota bacterium]|jgi:hypothetical protein
MENEKYRCSMTPFICSIVPIGAVGLVALVAFVFPAESNCFGLPNSLMDVVKSLIPCCTIPLVVLMMVPMGIYSIISGMAEIRIPDVRGKSLLVVAIFLGVLDIAAGAYFLLYLFSKIF